MFEVYTSTAARGERTAFGIVVRSADGQAVRVIGRSLETAARDEAAYRALLHALWKAKGLGARRVRIYSDRSEVVTQLEGQSEVPPPLLGLYLQTKAMLNAYRWSSVEFIAPEHNTEAALVAAGALERAAEAERADLDDLDLLPLWSSAEHSPAGAGSR